ncbi:nucleoid-associated protein YgaU [Breoghania corrubedonensis]|uniref:Nucleoid-associated protein YgaU n=1 Tax=Breoghania corrubedonensis TaxID=665038 RepID=A0A2T5VB17_9HYPH|nr:LysM peptidoglycan-binding domain-containing protein [Breoghania corrubedonensis]PTW60941.1 nucleoid-associated protein YgaU [Breoghania corrubedonensis]
MFKVLLAGLIGIAVAIALAIFGYQAGYFDSFRKAAEPAPQVAANGSQQAAKPGGEPPLSGKGQADNTASGAQTSNAATSTASGSSTQSPAGNAKAAPAIAPTFDVVRVEPSGDAVVAGLAEADATVALVANGKVIARTKSNSAGEWAIVLDDPLGPGDYDIAIYSEKEGEAATESTQRVTVSIPRDKDNGDVLVVMNAEGEASTILQKPGDRQPAVVASKASPAMTAETSQSETGQDAASAVEGAGDEARVMAEATPTGEKEVAASDEAAPSDGDTAGETTIAKASTGGASETPAASSDEGASATTGGTSASSATGRADKSGTEQGNNPGLTAAAEATVASVAAGDANTTSSPATGASEGKQDDVSRFHVTVDAVESEKGKIFVAGTSNPGARLRIYIGKDYLGETTARANGRWLLETEHDVPAGKHEVRADLVEGPEGTVLARAEVTFERAPDAVILTQVAAEGEAGEGTGASATATARVPNVIIRKGDNLWTISRRLYGKGMRYTTIYEANQGQIRNPDLIYPGQVFLTPVGDDAWKGDREDPSATN